MRLFALVGVFVVFYIYFFNLLKRIGCSVDSGVTSIVTIPVYEHFRRSIDTVVDSAIVFHITCADMSSYF